MSYNNNWAKTLSESYIQNNRPTNLQEQLDEQVELNEQLMNLIEALCEELGIDMEDLLNLSEDLQTDERQEELAKKYVKAEGRGDGRRASNINRKANAERTNPRKIFGKGGKVVGTTGGKKHSMKLGTVENPDFRDARRKTK